MTQTVEHDLSEDQEEFHIEPGSYPVEDLVTEADGSVAMEIAQRIRFLRPKAKAKPLNIATIAAGASLIGAAFLRFQTGMETSYNYQRLMSMYPDIFLPSLALDIRSTIFSSALIAVGGFMVGAAGVKGLSDSIGAGQEMSGLIGPLTTHLLQKSLGEVSDIKG